jgi:N-acetyl sugar amidotransferase
MKYCIKCVLPDTKPGLIFDSEGVCSACRFAEIKKTINWEERIVKLTEICERAKKLSKEYDCIVPVSGGKDSMFQVYYMKHIMKMKVLCVSAMAHIQTEEGISNLNSMVKNLDVDLHQINVSPKVLKKLRNICFFKLGNPNYAEHRIVFSAVTRAAVEYEIPLVVWGEDIGVEFGGNIDKNSLESGSANSIINNDLFRESSFDQLTENEITDAELFFYNYPSIEEFSNKHIETIYLSHFLHWDGYKNYMKSKEYGFIGRVKGPLSGNVLNYDNIDEKLCEINIWLKFLKLGFWRPHDACSYQIWNGRMTREEAVQIVNSKMYEFPIEYVKEYLEYHNLTEEQFYTNLEKWRNPNIWKQNNDLSWTLKNPLI